MQYFRHSFTGTLCALACAVVVGAFPHPVSAAPLSPEQIARVVEKLIPNSPMVAIARCESGLRQFDDSGSVLRGGLGKAMIGVFQLNERYHREPARSLGYNINSVLGNIAYARELYRTEGVSPWASSEHCWSKVQSPATLTKTLRYGMTDDEVALLQTLLNKAGYRAVAEGGETTYFGTATFRALTRFQCAHDIGCAFAKGNEYGRVGPRTRAALMERG